MTQVAQGRIGDDAPVEMPPDWDAITEEIGCPLCEYNLRGLSEPRCPECGHRFAWSELLDPTHRLHPYLFEHHPERNIWSFVKTALGQWRPIRFWKGLDLRQPSAPLRLHRYWLCIAILFAGVVYHGVTKSVSNTREMNELDRAAINMNKTEVLKNDKSILSQYGSLDAYMEAELPISTFEIARRRYLQGRDSGVFVLPLLFMWPWLTFLILIVFCKSLSTKNIRASHLMRVVVYSCDVVILPCIAAHCAVVLTQQHFSRGSLLFWNNEVHEVLGPLLAIAALAWLFRLAVAFKFYLRFKWPTMTMLLSQLLLVFVLISALGGRNSWIGRKLFDALEQIIS